MVGRGPRYGLRNSRSSQAMPTSAVTVEPTSHIQAIGVIVNTSPASAARRNSMTPISAIPHSQMPSAQRRNRLGGCGGRTDFTRRPRRRPSRPGRAAN